MQTMKDNSELHSFIAQQWEENCIPHIMEYIKIPNMSPFFDKDVLTNGLMDKAMNLIENWVRSQALEGLTIRRLQEPGRTPLLYMEVQPSDSSSLLEVGTVLMYGHMDKQPPFEGWSEGLNAYQPVIKDGRLYGRGGADDGYSCFCAILSLKALQKHNINHGRIVIIIEACEESGSPDLPFYIEFLKQDIGEPNLIICLDSGCGNYEQLWITSSLRGLIGGHLNCQILTEGVHSGDASGVVPDTFRIVRSLLSRIEDETTGEIKINDFFANLSEKRVKQLEQAAAVLKERGILSRFPFVPGAQPMSSTAVNMALNRWWRPQLTITGCSGMPPCDTAGNVLRPNTKVTLSLRLPPTVDAKEAAKKLKDVLLSDPPYNCKVSFEGEKAASGWAAPEVAPWLDNAVEVTSKIVFGKAPVYHAEGGSIPFMAMLGRLFPKAQFVVTGVLGPGSNAHGPNEFLHIDYSAKLTSCVALLVKSHFESKVEALLQESEQPQNKKTRTDEDLTLEYTRRTDGTKM